MIDNCECEDPCLKEHRSLQGSSRLTGSFGHRNLTEDCLSTVTTVVCCWKTLVIEKKGKRTLHNMATIPDFLRNRPVHDALNPVAWLIGRWVSECGSGQYPTLTPFKYCEQIEFRSLGQPLLQYESTTWNPESKNAMHLESGFLCAKPGTKELSFLLAHNFGLTTLEEGYVFEKSITLKSSNIARMSFTKDSRVLEVQRNFDLKGDELEQVVYMQTENTPLTEHLRVVYKRAA